MTNGLCESQKGRPSGPEAASWVIRNCGQVSTEAQIFAGELACFCEQQTPWNFLSCVLFGFLEECLGVIWVHFWLGDSEVCIVKDEE